MPKIATGGGRRVVREYPKKHRYELEADSYVSIFNDHYWRKSLWGATLLAWMLRLNGSKWVRIVDRGFEGDDPRDAIVELSRKRSSVLGNIADPLREDAHK